MDDENNLKSLKNIGRTWHQVPAELRHLPREVCEQNRSGLPGSEGPSHISKVGQFLALSAIDSRFLSGLCCDFIQILGVFVWPEHA